MATNISDVFGTVSFDDLVGYFGGILSSISFVPQVVKIIKTKSAEDLSNPTLVLLLSNATIWLIYGVLIDKKPIWITNAIVVSMIICMIVLKIFYHNKMRRAKRRGL